MVPLTIQALAISTMSSSLWLHDSNLRNYIGSQQLMAYAAELKLKLVDLAIEHEAVTRTQTGKDELRHIADRLQIMRALTTPFLRQDVARLSTITNEVVARLSEGDNNLPEMVLENCQKLDAEIDHLTSLPVTKPESLTSQFRTATFAATSSLVAAAVCGAFLLISLSSNTRKIKQNCERYWKREELLDVNESIRELKSLDVSFREMFATVENAEKAERALFNNIQDMIILLDENRRIINANIVAQKMFENLIGKKFDVLLVPLEVTEMENTLATSRNCGQPIRTICSLLSKDGEALFVEAAVQWDRQTASYYLLARDLTREKETEELKSEFFRRIRHKLSRPILDLQKIAEEFEFGQYGELNARGRKSLSGSRSSLERLGRLLKELNAITELHTFELSFTPSEFALDQLLNQSAAELSSLAQSRDVTISCDVAEGVLYADREKLLQVLINLLSNAIKFSPAGGQVTLSASISDSVCKIAVSDSGIGMSEEQLGSLFTQYEQFRATADGGEHAATMDGTGLGLYICKQIIERLSGTIEVRSSVGNGTTFTIKLPQHKP